MKKIVILNVLFNLLVGAFFVFLNMRAIALQYEETFIVYALIYGIVVTIGNSLFVIYSK